MSAVVAPLPVIGQESNLTRYLQEIRRFPMLDVGEEYMLAKSANPRRTLVQSRCPMEPYDPLRCPCAAGRRGLAHSVQ